jgi:hypothetical protein
MDGRDTPEKPGPQALRAGPSVGPGGTMDRRSGGSGSHGPASAIRVADIPGRSAVPGRSITAMRIAATASARTVRPVRSAGSRSPGNAALGLASKGSGPDRSGRIDQGRGGPGVPACAPRLDPRPPFFCPFSRRVGPRPSVHSTGNRGPASLTNVLRGGREKKRGGCAPLP